MKTRAAVIVFLLFISLISACGGGGGDSSSKDLLIIEPDIVPSPSEADILASASRSKAIVKMRDFPLSGMNVQQVLVTIKEVRIGSDEKGWMVINDQPQEYDLLVLVNNVAVVLGGASIEPGTYDQIRLILSEENRVFADGAQHSLKVPSGGQTGIKLDGPFTVGGGGILTIELDFNAQESVHWNEGQGFMLKPVIKIVSVTSEDGLFGSRQITASQGGTVALPDGAMVQIPAGALAQDAEVTIEKVSNSSGGSVVTDVYYLNPDGATFAGPVLVRLPYNPQAIPQGDTINDLVLTSNFERLKGTAVDVNQNALAAYVSHFSPVFGESTREKPANIANGILDYDHDNEKIGYHVVSVDLQDTGIELKTLIGPDKGNGVYELQTVKQMVEDAENNELLPTESIPVAINGTFWDGDKGAPGICGVFDCTGTLQNTTYVDGEEKLFCDSSYPIPFIPTPPCPENEVKFAFSDDTPVGAQIGNWNNQADIPFKWGVLGTYKTVIWNGTFGNETGKYKDEDISASMRAYNARTAIGLDKNRTRLFLLVADSGMNLKSVFNKLYSFGAYKAVLLDGGDSSTMVIDNDMVIGLTGGGRYIINGLAVVSVPVISPPGPSPINVDDLPEANITIGNCLLGDRFCLLGPQESWYPRPDLGYADHMWYTFANDASKGVQNVAKWIPQILDSGTYRVKAYIPRNCATTTCARYQVFHGAGGQQKTCPVINQYDIYDDFADLGSYYFEAGSGYVELDDLTYEAWITSSSPARQLGIDLVRFEPVPNGSPDATPDVDYCDETVFRDMCEKTVSKSVPCKP